MAQWIHMSQMIQCLPHETVNNLYPPSAFPIEVRHFLAEWIENQRWDDFALEKVEQESQARALLDQTISLLQSIAQENANVVDRMKLMQISRNMVRGLCHSVNVNLFNASLTKSNVNYFSFNAEIMFPHSCNYFFPVSSLVVEKQPPQVIKTQSKFSTTVRYLLGEKVAPGKPVVLKAQIINELQARNLGSVPGDNVGELINNTAILEHNTSSKSTCATFRNMSIKKIKRADRKGSESVTEEKFALLFSTEITITGCDTPYRIQMISLPVVVIVHGSQDNNALATIIWDCAFSEPDRVPFVVPERVPWRMMYSTLNSKFTAEVQTNHNLDQYNQHFLAQKIFDKPDFADDFSNIMVSWAQFNKEVLPGRPFTFWQWFEGVMDLTKKHLKTYWSQGLIFGFIGKQHLHLILKDRPNGTFLLRFSDSEIGGITIAYVSASENGGQKIQNIQPFTKRDLEIRSLGDRIRDISHITHLYPEYPKHEVFKGFYSGNGLHAQSLLYVVKFK
uniref:Signal transducer and activator of transcription 6, interleukin-4 induced n=1 Tax=Dicentrarchus labrax TaxID=13489 RepID=A0A8C4I9F8_DICLA